MGKIQTSLGKLVLSIGCERENGPVLPETREPVFLDFGRLDAGIIDQVRPEIVTSWLFCAAYDAYDICRFLTEAEYRGRYVAVATHLPKPAAVTREIRRFYPRIDFSILCPATMAPAARSYAERMASPQAAPVLAPA